MKNSKWFVMVSIAMLLLSQVFAQSELPISSPAVMRAYALKQVREVHASLYAPSIAQSGYDSREWLGEKPSPELLGEAGKLRLSAQTVDPNEVVMVYVSMTNADGDNLFYGYTETKPIKSADKWVLPESAGAISMRLSEVPVTFEKVVAQASILFRNADGVLVSEDLRFDGRKVFLPQELAGLSGAFVRIQFGDGTSVSYSASTGQALPTTTLGSQIVGSFRDIFSFRDADVSLTVASQGGRGTNPTIEIVRTAGGGLVTFTVSTSEGKKPIGFWLLRPGFKEWTRFETSGGTMAIGNFPTGTTYAVPIWNPVDFADKS